MSSSSSTPSLTIQGCSISSLPTIKPNLMPFHIDYTGPAPVSTFMSVKERAGPSNQDAPAPGPDSGSKKEYDAVFRGRAMVGLDMSLPTGYTGVVLRGDPVGDSAGPSLRKTERNPVSRTSSRITRRSSRSTAMAIDVDDNDEIDALEAVAHSQALTELNATGAEDERSNTRYLRPVSGFDSLIIWEADNPVDEGKDEYVRSLREWTALAELIHQPEDEVP